MSLIRYTLRKTSKLPSFITTTHLLRIRASPGGYLTFENQQCWYTSPVNSTQEPHPTTKKPATLVPSPSSVSKPKPQQPLTRHEVHEGTEALNVPYNPPGGGPGANIPGGGLSFSFTKFPLFDAMLTTFIGLGAGEFQ